MSNGIRSLPRYQIGGSTDPDQEERRRRLWQLMAEQRAPFRPDYTAGLPFSRPDTLMGEERGDMMRFFHDAGGDTTKISQEGISDFLQGDEYGDLLGLTAQIREQYNSGIPSGSSYRLPSQRVPSVATYAPTSTFWGAGAGGDYFGGGAGGPGRPGIPGGGEPWILGPEEIASLTPQERSLYERGVDSIRLNILNSMISKHGPETRVPGPYESFLTTSRDRRVGQIDQIRDWGWHTEPEDILRNTLTHELGHSLGAGERGSDNFEAVVRAVRSASPDASREDVLDAAQKIYWESSNAYKSRHAGREQFGAGRGHTSGVGTPEDPIVVDPNWIESPSLVRQQKNEMRPWLEKILATEGYAGHPIHALEAERIELERLNNRGLLERLSDRVRGGIASLRGGQ